LVKGGNDILTNIVPVCVNCHNLIHSSHLATNHSTLIKEGLQKRKAEDKPIGRSKG
jgi:predicted HNH restriction endonuclease